MRTTATLFDSTQAGNQNTPATGSGSWETAPSATGAFNIIHSPNRRGQNNLHGRSDLDHPESESNQYSEQCEDYLLQLMIAVDELRRSGQLCDVILQAGSTHIPAHRTILASSSPYFYAMLTGPMSEASSDCITIHGIDGAALTQLVDFIYTGKVTVTENNVQALLTAANLCQLTDVRDICCRFLESQLHPTNCLGIWRFADLHSCTQLSQVSRQYAGEHYSELIKSSPEFVALTSEELEKLLSSDELSVSQDDIFESIRRWENHAPTERANAAESLYTHVNFSLLSSECLIRVSQLKDFLASKPACKDYIIEAYTSRFLSLHGTASNCNHMTKVLLVFGGEEHNRIRLPTECYDFSTGEWKFINSTGQGSPPLERRECGSVAVGNLLYVLGGVGNSGVKDSVHIYDAAKNSWTPGPVMNRRRFGLGVSFLNGEIYAIGGQNKYHLRASEVLDITSGSWRLIAQMRTARFRLGVATVNTKVYAVGGENSPDTMECYDPSNDSWTFVNHRRFGFTSSAIGAFNGLLYTFGGYKTDDNPAFKNSIEFFVEPIGWVGRSSVLVHGRRDASVVAHEGCLYVVGGEGPSGLLTSVEKYDPSEVISTELPKKMKFSRKRPVVAVLEVYRHLALTDKWG